MSDETDIIDATVWGATLADFRDRTASAEPTPGGGSVAAVSATLGMGLVVMALEISAKRKDVTRPEEIAELIGRGRELLGQLTADAGRDIAAFQNYMAALKLPKATPEEKTERSAAMQGAVRGATQAPIETALHIVEGLRIAVLAEPLSHSHVVSDVGAGAGLLEGALKAVLFNVDVNLPGVNDASAKASWAESRVNLAREGAEVAGVVLAAVAVRLTPAG